MNVRFLKFTVGGLLLGLGVGIWIGAALVAGTDMDGVSVLPSLLLAGVGSGMISGAVSKTVTARTGLNTEAHLPPG